MQKAMRELWLSHLNFMKPTRFIFCLLLAPCLYSAQCLTIAASAYGGWKPVSTAPRDGTIIEMLETYGVAPWYGLFKWDKSFSKSMTAVTGKPYWQSIDKPSTAVSEDKCLFWRPYKGIGKYVDPTGGFQDFPAYECIYMHLAYNAVKRVCVNNP